MQVTFDAFKDSFIRVLSEMDGILSDDEKDAGHDEDAEETADQRELIRRLQELTDFSGLYYLLK